MNQFNGQVILIPVADIEPPEFPRYHSPAEIQMIADDIKLNNRQIEEGTVEPNPLGEAGGKPWRLIVGWCRLQALPLIGWTQMRCMVVDGLTKLQKLQLVSSENAKRTGATPFFQAYLLKEMLSEIPEAERNQKKLAEISGFNESDVSEYLAISKIPDDLRAEFERSNFTFAQLREIIRTENTDQLRRVGVKAIKKELSSREIKNEVEKVKKAAAGKAAKRETDPSTQPEMTLKVGQKQGILKITATFARAEDLTPTLTKLCADIVQWCAQHPNPGRPKKATPQEHEQYGRTK